MNQQLNYNNLRSMGSKCLMCASAFPPPPLSLLFDVQGHPAFCGQTCVDSAKEYSLLLQESDEETNKDSKVLNLTGDQARRMLDIMHQALIEPKFLAVQASKSWLRKTMNKLRLRSGQIPKSLYVEGITCDISQLVGSGGFADVYKGKYGSTVVAVKRPKIYISDQKSEQEVLKSLYREAFTWRGLDHPHVLPLFGVCTTVFENKSCLISPWMENGTIRGAISALRRQPELCRFSTLREQLVQWFGEIVQGLKYLHDEQIVHGDLRGANILINDDWTVRLADFGLAVFAHEASHLHGSPRAGNARWLAPEILDPESSHTNSCRPTFASDVYSFGCLGIEIFTNSPPFPELYYDAQVSCKVSKGCRPPRPGVDGKPGESIPDDIWSMIERCWSMNPSDRPTSTAISESVALYIKPSGHRSEVSLALRSQDTRKGAPRLYYPLSLCMDNDHTPLQSLTRKRKADSNYTNSQPEAHSDPPSTDARNTLEPSARPKIKAPEHSLIHPDLLATHARPQTKVPSWRSSSPCTAASSTSTTYQESPSSSKRSRIEIAPSIFPSPTSGRKAPSAAAIASREMARYVHPVGRHSRDY